MDIFRDYDLWVNDFFIEGIELIEKRVLNLGDLGGMVFEYILNVIV